MMSKAPPQLHIGWASADLTPDEPVMICGQFHARISEGVSDPVTVTAMAIESQNSAGGGPVRCVMAACDVAVIPDELRDAVRALLSQQLPELDPMCLVLHATHSHCAPELRAVDLEFGVGSNCGVELPVMAPGRYVDFAAGRIADAVVQAWHHRQPAGVAVALSHAAIGYNRRICYAGGETRMYGGVDRPDFIGIEGTHDTGVNVMGVWNEKRQLTGVVVNLACPSQVSEQDYQISADFWHETREALRDQLGQHIFVLPQVSAAGDIAPARPTTVPDYKALRRMWQLQGITQRQDIARRLTAAVASALSVAVDHIDWHPPAEHRVETVPLPRRTLVESDVNEALTEAAKFEQEYQSLRQQLDADPARRQQPRWYVPITHAYRRARWYQQVVERYELQKHQSMINTEVHILRLGDAAFATNRFEYYLDFGLQIKARSKADQTFIVQLAGPGGYLPTWRAVAGKSYGAVPASTIVGPDGGQLLADWTIEAINAMFDSESLPTTSPRVTAGPTTLT